MAGVQIKAAPLIITGLLGLVGVISVGAYRTGGELSGVQQSPPGSGAPLAVSAEGPTLYGENCAGCHGALAGGGVGPTLTGAALRWSAPQFSKAVLDGQKPDGTALAPTMPHFRTAGFGGEPPTEAQLSAVQAFLKGL